MELTRSERTSQKNLCTICICTQLLHNAKKPKCTPIKPASKCERTSKRPTWQFLLLFLSTLNMYVNKCKITLFPRPMSAISHVDDDKLLESLRKTESKMWRARDEDECKMTFCSYRLNIVITSKSHLYIYYDDNKK